MNSLIGKQTILSHFSYIVFYTAPDSVHCIWQDYCWELWSRKVRQWCDRGVCYNLHTKKRKANDDTKGGCFVAIIPKVQNFCISNLQCSKCAFCSIAFFLHTEDDMKEAGEELHKPIKKWPLAEAQQASFQMEQDCKFEWMMSVLEEQCECQQQLDVDPDVDAFVTGIAFSLQKSAGQQREHLFVEIRSLIYDTLYPCRVTAPRLHSVPQGEGLEPNLGQFHPPCPAASPMTPSAGFSNWSRPTSYQVDGSGEVTRNLSFDEM